MVYLQTKDQVDESDKQVDDNSDSRVDNSAVIVVARVVTGGYELRVKKAV